VLRLLAWLAECGFVSPLLYLQCSLHGDIFEPLAVPPLSMAHGFL
jgi:hypothetical protein